MPAPYRMLQGPAGFPLTPSLMGDPFIISFQIKNPRGNFPRGFLGTTVNLLNRQRVLLMKLIAHIIHRINYDSDRTRRRRHIISKP